MFRRKSAILLLWEMGGGEALGQLRHSVIWLQGTWGRVCLLRITSATGGVEAWPGRKGEGGVEMAGSLISPTDEGAVWER